MPRNEIAQYAIWYVVSQGMRNRSDALAMWIAAMTYALRRFPRMSMRRWGAVAPVPLAHSRVRTMTLIVTVTVTMTMTMTMTRRVWRWR